MSIVKHVNNKVEIIVNSPKNTWGFITFANNLERDVFIQSYKNWQSSCDKKPFDYEPNNNQEQFKDFNDFGQTETNVTFFDFTLPGTKPKSEQEVTTNEQLSES